MGTFSFLHYASSYDAVIRSRDFLPTAAPPPFSAIHGVGAVDAHGHAARAMTLRSRESLNLGLRLRDKRSLYEAIYVSIESIRAKNYPN